MRVRPDNAERNKSEQMRAATSAYHKGRKKNYRCGPVARPLCDRIKDRSMPVPWSGCWLWLGALDRDGYGHVMIKTGGGNEIRRGAHRASYEAFNGAIPDGLQIDHLCRVRCCVNPDHLEAVSCKENLHRGETRAAINGRKTHCKNGHPFNDSNTVVSNNKRVCRTCRNDRALSDYYRNRITNGT